MNGLNLHTIGHSEPSNTCRSAVDRSIPLAECGIDIDIFLAESEFQQDLIRRRVQHTIGGIPAWFVSVEDLILLKLIAGRPRDRADIDDLLLARSELDEGYLRRWAGPLGVESKLDEVLADR